MNDFKLEKQDGICRITVDCEHKLNAFSPEMFFELEKLLLDIRGDDDILAVIITGAGEKAFVAGTDLDKMKDMTEKEAFHLSSQSSRILRMMETMGKPFIAAVNGYAFGGGFEIALACDIRIACENAVFAFPEITFGIIPGSGGTQRLQRLIGASRAKYMLLTSARVKANEALAMGIVSEVVAKEELLSRANAIAKKLASYPPFAIKLLKDCIDRGAQTDLDTALRYESENFAKAFTKPDPCALMSGFINNTKK